MDYKEYLKSKHWIEFRKKILKVRTRCQSCGESYARFNIHHKHYNSLGREKNEDVLVLCEECHHENHKKRFNRYKRMGWMMDLKNKSKRARSGAKSKYEELRGGTIKRICRRCGEEHFIYYKNYEKCGLRMLMFCPESKPRTEFLRVEKDLDIPTLEGKKKTLEILSYGTN